VIEVVRKLLGGVWEWRKGEELKILNIDSKQERGRRDF
jgi:hypothetical protein